MMVTQNDEPDDGEGGSVPNSVTALERLRALLERATETGERQLPPERQLAAEIGVGRRALRRALEVLEAEGQIWRMQGKGTFLGAPPAATARIETLSTRTNPLEVMEVRIEIEPVLARLAAQRATPEDIEMMRQLSRRTLAAADADGRELWDAALHRRIAQAAGNRLFLALLEVVDRIRQDESFRVLRERARTGGILPFYAAQHERIIDAIAARDGAAAEAAMRQHLEAVAQRLTQSMAAPARAPAFAEDGPLPLHPPELQEMRNAADR